MKEIWLFLLKLLVFCVSYFFMLDYIVNCKLHTHIGSAVTLGMVIIITFLYIIFSK